MRTLLLIQFVSLEEVYFGKAKDVVGELRSKLLALADWEDATANMIDRSGTALRDEPGSRDATRDDQGHAEMIASWSCLFPGRPG